ncbi:MAG: hypothetical protein GHHEDOFH_02990 [Pseudorhodoplanes sp.]|nr:hypothetical protein [Pseudorhodoplanes sp.]
MARYDAVELGERLDLVDDHAAHLGGAFGGLRRHFQDAAAQLGAGGVELVLHLCRHLLDALQHVGEPLGRLAEDHMGVAHRLFVDVLHRVLGALALLFGAVAHQLEGFGDGLRALRAGVGDDAADLARARGGAFQRFVEQVGEALEPLVELLALDVEGGDQRVEIGAPLVDGFVGLAVADVDELHRLDQHAAVHVELAGEVAEVLGHLAGDALEGLDLVRHALGDVAGAAGGVVHHGGEFRHPAGERGLQPVHVLLRTRQHFLQQDIGLAQTLEQPAGIVAQAVVRLHHFRHRRGGHRLRALDGVLRGGMQRA